MMGIPSNEYHLYISEIEIKSARSVEASLQCNLPENALLSIIIQNEIGSIKYENQFQLKAGSNDLTFDLSELKFGNYHAWIDIAGQTFIRNIIIEEPIKSSNTWLSKVKNLFG